MSVAARAPRIRRKPEGLQSHVILLATLSTAALAGCLKVGEDVFSKETAPFDEPIRAWFLARQTALGERFFLFVTNSGGPSVVIPMSVVIGIWLRKQRNLPIAGAVMLAPAVALSVFSLVKQLFRRQRPEGATRRKVAHYSFPSGHSATSAAVFGTLAYVLWREEMIPKEVAAALAIVPPALIGTSRVYLDVHWATDVIGGWSVGTLVAAMSAVVYERVRTLTRERSTTLQRA
ncbi:MAG: phosphoesterase PA-phosphatase related protein [Gemmatimonadetes bacterium]|nr:phosphoesterase PA-phosphatase related protein [Gemmatimonadota bacterium]